MCAACSVTSWFDHDEIRSFLDVSLHRLERESPGGGRELVPGPVSELGPGARRVPERPVEHRGELGRIAHDAHAPVQTGLAQPQLDRPDATVHHV